MKRYEEIAQLIELQIQKGTLRISDKIPSIRHMAKREHVSVSTVLESYLLLEKKGIIESKPHSGFYVSRSTQGLPPEPEMQEIVPEVSSVQINDLVFEMFQAAQNPSIVSLGVSGPHPRLFPQARLNVLFRSIIRDIPNHSEVYHYPPGLKELREQIARRANEAGCLLSAKDLVITNGAMEAINLCLRAVAQSGDTIAVESPTNFVVLQILESLGMKAIEIPTHPRYGLNLERMEWALKHRDITAAIFMSNFNNPLGCLMPDEAKESLVRLFAKHDLPIIEDDVWGDLNHSGKRPKALRAFDKDGLVLWCSSFSKTLSPGFRVGWVTPGRFAKSIQRLKFMTSLASPGLAEWVLARYLAEGGYERHLRQLGQTYAEQMRSVQEGVFKYFPENTRVTRPLGGCVLWVEFPETLDTLKLYKKALLEKISITPGILFSASDRFQNCLRLNCANQWSPQIDKALMHVGEIAKSLS